MVEPCLWEETDILRLISNGVQESLTLDYKRCDSLQKTEGKKKVSLISGSRAGWV
jgi:hypothetical protein